MSNAAAPEVSTSKVPDIEVAADALYDLDERLIFNLGIISNIEQGNRLREQDAVLMVDERSLQSLQRWWTQDNRQKSSDQLFKIATETSDRVTELIARAVARSPVRSYDINLTLGKYLKALANSNVGLFNYSATYKDKMTQGKLTMIRQKIEDTIEELSTHIYQSKKSLKSEPDGAYIRSANRVLSVKKSS